MEFAKKHKLQYIEVSSKTGENINECFDAMHNIICERIDKQNTNTNIDIYTDTNANTDIYSSKKQNICCKL
uniref:Ras family GTPase n=1 Tax=Mimivirus LCMiAC02 TaxID=2506609 RepID=A0A4D5XF37_9VIRU|nr:MAG: Ras family GTPase [Mimivirus LCMiAC02]